MLGKKIGALMVMVLFIVSMIPMALAENENAGPALTQMGHVKDITETSHQKDIRDRSIQAQTSFGDVKSKIVNNRGEVARCLLNSGMSGCAELLGEDLKDRKEYLLNAVDRIKIVLDHLEDRIEAVSDNTEKDEMIQHIKDNIDELEEIRSTIDSINDRAELKEARDSLKESYSNMKTLIAEYRIFERIDRIHSINEKLVVLNSKLQNIADKLTSVTANLASEYPAKAAQLDTAIKEAEQRLETAKERYQHAVALKESGATDVEINAALSEAKDYLNQAVAKIKEVKNHVGNIITFFKNRAGAGQLDQAIAETTI